MDVIIVLTIHFYVRITSFVLTSITKLSIILGSIRRLRRPDFWVITESCIGTSPSSHRYSSCPGHLPTQLLHKEVNESKRLSFPFVLFNHFIRLGVHICCHFFKKKSRFPSFYFLRDLFVSNDK